MLQPVYVPIVLAAIAGVVWLVRLEGKMNMLAAKVEKLEKIAETSAAMATTIAVMNNDMGHMRTSMDGMNKLLVSLVGPSPAVQKRVRERVREEA